MTTTPRKRVNKRIRYYLKTIGVPVTGKCGHEYVARIEVPKDLQKLQRTPERDLQLQKTINYTKTGYALAQCQDCQAQQNLNEVRTKTEKLTRIYNLPPLPQLSGTPRMVSFAETIRYSWWETILTRINSQINEMINTPTIALTLMVSAINESFPVTRKTYSDDLIHLHYAIKQKRAIFSNNSKPGEIDWEIVTSLMAWLLVREETNNLEYPSTEWPAKNPIWFETQADVWIRAFKGNHAGELKKAFQNIVRLDTLTTALYTALRVDWDNREQMENNFQILQNKITKDESNFLAHSNQLPLPDALDQLTVFKGLTNPNLGNTWDFTGEDYNTPNRQLKAPF